MNLSCTLAATESASMPAAWRLFPQYDMRSYFAENQPSLNKLRVRSEQISDCDLRVSSAALGFSSTQGSFDIHE